MSAGQRDAGPDPRRQRPRPASVRRGPDASADEGPQAVVRAADLRLALPALAAWGMLAWLLARPAATLLGAAGAALVVAAAALLLARRLGRPRAAAGPDTWQAGRSRHPGGKPGAARLARRDGSRSAGARGEQDRQGGRSNGRAAVGHGPGAAGGRLRDVAAVVGTSALVVAAVLAGAGAHQLARTAGPIAEDAARHGRVTLEGVVDSDPRRLAVDAEHPRPRTVVRLLVRRVEAGGAGVGGAVAVRTPVLVLGSDGPGATLAGLHYWEHVRLTATLAPAEPGDDVTAVALVRDPPQVTAPAGPVGAVTEHVRSRMREAVAGLPEDPRGLVPALVLGDRGLTPDDLSDDMRLTGMSHLSAVSGSNVAIVLGAALALLRGVGCPRRLRPPLAALALAGFVALARPDPSVLRAAVMGGVGLWGMAASRRAAGLPALGAAIVALLLWDPWLSRAFGFALSVLATIGLLLFARPWASAIGARWPPRLRFAADALAIPLAAGAVTAPVVVLLSGTVSLVSIGANVLAAPFVAPATLAGVGTAVVASFWPLGGTLLAWVAVWPAWAIAAVARHAADVPAGAVPWRADGLGALALTALLLVAVLSGPWLVWATRRGAAAAGERLGTRGPARWQACALAARLRGEPGPPGRRRWLVLPAAAVVVLLVAVLGRPADRLQAWVFAACDVGQGDALVLATGPGHGIVVDAGPDPRLVDACLDDLGIAQVDALVLTHFHLDHVGGVTGVSHGRAVHALFVSPVAEPAGQARDVARWAQGLGLRQVPLVAGDHLDLGGVAATVLAPSHRPVAGSIPNNASVVLDVESGGLRLLLLGDVERESAHDVATALAASPDRHPIDVLKVAHHGSANTDPSLVAGVHAALAVVSVGRGNDYGHPAPSTLRLLQNASARTLRTDDDGQVRIGRDADGYLLDTSGAR